MYSQSVNNTRPPPSYSGPPPSYRSTSPPYDDSAWRSATESATLLNKHDEPRSAPRIRRILTATLGCLLLVLFLAQNLGLVTCPMDNVSAAEKRALRRQWKAEKTAHDANVRGWNQERAFHEKEVRGWEQQRAEWREEERQWEERRRDEERHRKEIERRRQGVWWTEPVGDAGCVAYGTRAYRARLMDIPQNLNWREVCEDMPVTIHERAIDAPDKCEKLKRKVWATWYIEDPQCTTYWDRLSHLGCSAGRTGFRRYSSRLMNLRRGDDWNKMCSTTPATISNVQFDHPTICVDENRGRTGIWDVPDSSCE
ncbi:hypothetical protein C8Q76DRAFT_720350 [Earliella scabrosa]|nr:hypothetical protein C8Q76DRAFT_720350 [Earliella scabrosa]